MLTKVGLKRMINLLKRMADKNDPEFNEVLQEAVRGINRLIAARNPTLPPTL